MKIAFLYAGQGSQKVGMGQDLYETYPAFKEVLDSLPQSEEIRRISFEGSAEILAQTRNTQPCMVAFAAGLTQLLYDHGIRPAMAAGLSLGEYSALHAAGVVTTQEAVNLVHFRGLAMEQAAAGIDSKMVAVLTAAVQLVQDACGLVKALGVAEVANLNCPGQVVISGERKAVEEVERILTEAGVKRCIPLAVSGPFHTSLMAPAGKALETHLQNSQLQALQFPVLFNATGQPLQEGKTIQEMMVQQVQSSTLFEQTIRTMLEMGVDTFVEIGPGKVLSGFVRRIDASIPCYAVEDVPSLEKTIQEIRGIT